MDDVDKLKESVDQEQQHLSQFLKKAKNVIDLVPVVHHRLEETKVKQMVVTSMPEDALSAVAHQLLPIQLGDQRRTEDAIPPLPDMPKDASQCVAASGTASPWSQAVTDALRLRPEEPDWAPPVLQAVDELADEKVRRGQLPPALERINSDLGETFEVAVESYEKANVGILGVDQAAIRMRDTVEQAWGGLVEHARQKCPRPVPKEGLELRKTTAREAVAQCLATDRTRLIGVLEDLYQLHHKDLSPMCKQPLSKDFGALERVYTRWILLLDDVCKSVTV